MGEILDNLAKYSQISSAISLSRISELGSKSDSQTHTDLENLKKSIEDNGRQIAEASRKGNRILTQQLEAQQNQLQLQKEQLESQLRMEAADTQARAKEAADDQIVNSIFDIVEEAKNCLRDQNFYGGLIYAVGARKLYKVLLPNINKSDAKIKVSVLNSSACDIIDDVFSPEKFPNLSKEALSISDGLKNLVSATSVEDVATFLKGQKHNLDSVSLDKADIPTLQSIDVSLATLDTQLISKKEQLSVFSKDIERIEPVLDPLFRNVVRDYLSQHESDVESIRQTLKKASGIGIDEIDSNFQKLRECQSILSDLRAVINTTRSLIGARISGIKNADLKKRMKQLNWGFFLIVFGGFFVVGAVLNSISEDNPVGDVVTALYLIASVSIWWMRRTRRKKVRIELGIG